MKSYILFILVTSIACKTHLEQESRKSSTTQSNQSSQNNTSTNTQTSQGPVSEESSFDEYFPPPLAPDGGILFDDAGTIIHGPLKSHYEKKRDAGAVVTNQQQDSQTTMDASVSTNTEEDEKLRKDVKPSGGCTFGLGVSGTIIFILIIGAVFLYFKTRKKLPI